MSLYYHATLPNTIVPIDGFRGYNRNPRRAGGTDCQ